MNSLFVNSLSDKESRREREKKDRSTMIKKLQENHLLTLKSQQVHYQQMLLQLSTKELRGEHKSTQLTISFSPPPFLPDLIYSWSLLFSLFCLFYLILAIVCRMHAYKHLFDEEFTGNEKSCSTLTSANQHLT